MSEGLIVFTSHQVEEQLLQCLGCTRVPNARGAYVNRYYVQKYRMQGAVYDETVIRASGVVGKAQRLKERLGCANVYIVDMRETSSEISLPQGIFIVNTLQDVVARFQLRLSATQCEQVKRLLENEHQPQTLRNMENPETPGDAERHYADQFFVALSAGRHMRPPDVDLFQGNTAVFLLQGGERFAIVHNSDEDADFRIAQQLSLQEEQPNSTKRTRRNTTPPTWQTVLKEPDALSTGCAACITCRAHRASICFAECGHQVMCDACVRQMCELPGVRRACPVCRCEFETILRPVLSEVEK